MAPYDSDVSDGEADDYTETSVLLGYASKDARGETISRLGGRPVCRGPLSSADLPLAMAELT
jgi:pre-rRNA-processing protein TSR4